MPSSLPLSHNEVCSFKGLQARIQDGERDRRKEGWGKERERDSRNERGERQLREIKNNDMERKRERSK